MSKQNRTVNRDYSTKICLLFCTIASLVLALRANWGRIPFWDLHPVFNAINDYGLGLNPYRFQEQSMFIYHPLVLRLLSSINELIDISTFFNVAYVLILIWFIFESIRFLGNREAKLNRYQPIVIAMVFGGVAINALLCGNFSAYFHLIVISLIFNYLNRPRIFCLFLFGIAIVCFAIVKPYFLAYVLFYFLVLRPKNAIATGILTSLALVALWFGGALLFADQYSDFLQALQYQLVAKNDLGGYSTLRIFGPYLGYQWAFMLHVTIMGLVCLLALIRISRNQLLAYDIKSQALLLILFIIFANPRIVFYDFFAAIFVLVYFLITNNQKCQQILLFGFPLAIYSQLAEHSIRWIILAYAMMSLTAMAESVLRNKSKLDQN